VALRCPDGTQFLSYWPTLAASGRLLSSDDPIVDSTDPKSLAVGEQLIVDDSLPIPPNTQQNLPDRQSWLGHRLRRLTTIRPFSLDVVVSDPLFITNPLHYPLQKWIDFVAIQQRFADGNSLHEVFFALTRVASIH